MFVLYIMIAFVCHTGIYYFILNDKIYSRKERIIYSIVGGALWPIIYMVLVSQLLFWKDFD